MVVRYDFHPEALFEFAEATKSYRDEASVQLADQFVSLVEYALADLVAGPMRWRIVEEPEIRR